MVGIRGLMGLGLGVAPRAGSGAGVTFDFVVTSNAELATLMAGDPEDLAGKLVGIAPGTYTAPRFGRTSAQFTSSGAFEPSVKVTFSPTGAGVILDQALITNCGNFRFEGLKFVSSDYASTEGYEPVDAIRLGGTVEALEISGNEIRGNLRGDIAAEIDPTDIGGVVGDNRYVELASIVPTVDGSGAITSLQIMNKNIDLADGTYDLTFDGTAGGSSGSGATGTFTVVSGVIVSTNLTAPGSGYVQSGLGRICSWASRTKLNLVNGIGSVTTEGTRDLLGPFLIEDNHFHQLNNAIKVPAPELGSIKQRNWFDRVYQDNMAYLTNNTTFPAYDIIRHNLVTRPWCRVGRDPGDPHADAIQRSMQGQLGLWPLDCYDNLVLIGNARGEIQGMVMGNQGEEADTTAFTAGPENIGVSGNTFLIANTNSGISFQNGRELPIYGNTVVVYDAAASSGVTVSIGVDYERSHKGVHVVGNITERVTELEAPLLDVTSVPNVVLGAEGATIAYASVFESPASLPTTAAEVMAAFQSKGVAASVGAIRATPFVDHVNHTIDLTQMPTLVKFFDVEGVAQSSTQTSNASKIVGGPLSVAIVPGSGTEWRVADDEAMTTNATAWSSSSATGDYRGKFLQIRRSASASYATTLAASVTLNGLAWSFSMTTVSSVNFPAVTNSGTAYSRILAPTPNVSNLTRGLIAIRARANGAQSAGAPLIEAGSASQFQIYYATTTGLRASCQDAGWSFRTYYSEDSQWHTHLIALDVSAAAALADQKWTVDSTSLLRDPASDSSGIGTGLMQTNRLFLNGLGVFAEGDGGTPIFNGEMEYLWMHFGTAAGFTIPDIEDPAVRASFLGDNINMTDGSGPLGVQPMFFYHGDAAAWNAGIANKGSVSGATLTKMAGTYTDV